MYTHGGKWEILIKILVGNPKGREHQLRDVEWEHNTKMDFVYQVALLRTELGEFFPAE